MLPLKNHTKKIYKNHSPALAIANKVHLEPAIFHIILKRLESFLLENLDSRMKNVEYE